MLLAVPLHAQDDATPVKDVAWYLNQARTYQHHSKLDLAIEALYKAQELAEKKNDEKGLVQAYQRMSFVYLDLERPKNTEFYHDKAGDMLKSMEYPYGSAVQKYISAILQFKGSNNFQALYTLIDAKRLNNDRNLLNNILLTEGDIYLNSKNYDSALKSYNSLIVN